MKVERSKVQACWLLQMVYAVLNLIRLAMNHPGMGKLDAELSSFDVAFSFFEF